LPKGSSHAYPSVSVLPSCRQPLLQKMASIIVKIASMALLCGASHVQRDFPYAEYAGSVGTPEAQPASKPSHKSSSTAEHDAGERPIKAKEHDAVAKAAKGSTDPSALKSEKSAGMGAVTSSMQREKQALASLSAALAKYEDAAADAEVLQKEVDTSETEHQLAAKAVADAVGLVRDAKSQRLKAVKADMRSDPLAAKASPANTMASAETVVASAQKRLVDASARLKTASSAVEKATAKANVGAERKSKYEEQVKDARQKADEASKEVTKAQEQHAREEQKKASDAEDLQKQVSEIKERLEKTVFASKGAPHAAQKAAEGK